MRVYAKYRCSIVAIEEVSMYQTHRYGIVSGSFINDSSEIFQVSGMIEKSNIEDADLVFGHLFMKSICDMEINTN